MIKHRFFRTSWKKKQNHKKVCSQAWVEMTEDLLILIKFWMVKRLERTLWSRIFLAGTLKNKSKSTSTKTIKVDIMIWDCQQILKMELKRIDHIALLILDMCFLFMISFKIKKINSGQNMNQIKKLTYFLLTTSQNYHWQEVMVLTIKNIKWQTKKEMNWTKFWKKEKWLFQ